MVIFWFSKLEDNYLEFYENSGVHTNWYEANWSPSAKIKSLILIFAASTRRSDQKGDQKILNSDVLRLHCRELDGLRVLYALWSSDRSHDLQLRLSRERYHVRLMSWFDVTNCIGPRPFRSCFQLLRFCPTLAIHRKSRFEPKSKFFSAFCSEKRKYSFAWKIIFGFMGTLRFNNIP